ncbi:unnamed protein product [Dicrocoelium dendriticum]|nr:unnamed protein product [Dicrocoelium dendriticum]
MEYRLLCLNSEALISSYCFKIFLSYPRGLGLFQMCRNMQIQTSYRPISHNSILCRTMARTTKAKVVEYLSFRNLTNTFQYGLLSTRSCITCQVHMLNFVTRAIDRGKRLIIRFVDVHTAFDRVSHWKSSIESTFLRYYWQFTFPDIIIYSCSAAGSWNTKQ